MKTWSCAPRVPRVARVQAAGLLFLLALTLAGCSAVGTATGTSSGGATATAASPASASATPSPSSSPAVLHGIVLARPCTGGPERAGDSVCPGLPLPGVTVEFTPAAGPAVQVRTAADGTFGAELPAGRYTVTIPGRHLLSPAQPVGLEVPAQPAALDPAGRFVLVVDSGMR